MISAPADVTAYWQTARAFMRHEDVVQYRNDIGKRLPDAFPPGTLALDYGCGGGAGLALLHERGCEPTGVDLVMSNERFPVLRPDTIAALPCGSFDAVISTSCFQHFPDTYYARTVLAELHRLSKPRAFGLIQVRYYTPGDAYDPENQPAPYAKRAVRAHSWRVEAFWQALADAGFTPRTVELEPWRHYAWYRFDG